MVEVAWFLTDLLDFFYQLAWLVFLTQKLYGQVTTTALHIFELNVLLQNTISVFFWILIDLGALDGYKYLKNTLMSLLILSFHLPWYSTFLYGFITNSGCEDPTFWWMMEIIQYLNAVFDIFLPLLIKLKLDRLSQ